MLKLCGLSISNYYNKVKLSLLEKGIPFEEETAYPYKDETLKKDSPMGKIPFLRTPHGVLTESHVLTEYIEDTHPQPPLYPADAFLRAKCREMIAHIELDIELQARRLYPEAFFGGRVSEETKKKVEKLLAKGMKSLAHLARFEPFIAGKEFSHADCAAFIHLPLVSLATKKIYGRDMVEEFLPASRSYLMMIAERKPAQRVSEDRRVAMEAFAAANSK